MKTRSAILMAALVSTATARADEGHDHPAGGGLFGLPPEYVHVLLNPLPVYGMAMGVLALGAALLARNKTARVIALGLVIIAAASAWPVAHYGQNAYKEIRGLADETGQARLAEHMERSDKLIYVFYATALLGAAALVSQKKSPRAATPLATVTLIAAIASLGTGDGSARRADRFGTLNFAGQQRLQRTPLHTNTAHLNNCMRKCSSSRRQAASTNTEKPPSRPPRKSPCRKLSKAS